MTSLLCLWHVCFGIRGGGEFVHAVQILKKTGLNFRVMLIVSPDNPASVSEVQLNKWDTNGDVEWKGHVDDVASVLANSQISVLPSYYGEEVPESLIEAAACGRPIITTDMPGCREIVENNINGLLVPPQDAKSLAEAMSVLIQDKEKRLQMGLFWAEKE